MKIKLFLVLEIQYFELRIFPFNWYVYYLTRGFIASTRAFNLLTRAFSLLTCGFELVTPGFELVTRNSCFTFLPVRPLSTEFLFVRFYIAKNIYCDRDYGYKVRICT